MQLDTNNLTIDFFYFKIIIDKDKIKKGRNKIEIY